MPKTGEQWQFGKRESIGKDRSNHHALCEVLTEAVSHHPWHWPKRPIYFIADPHADAEAFTASLIASGGVHRNTPRNATIKLTAAGRNGVFVIGGDCLDKGPSNLELLRRIRNLMDSGARVKLLAGNHDMRLLMGIRAMSLKRDPRTEHLFVRMGAKVVPLLKEVHGQYLDGTPYLKKTPKKEACRRKLFPSRNWFRKFAREATWVMPEQTVKRELARMHKKVSNFENTCNDAGLTIRDVYATACKCRELFLEKNGEFSWFYDDMQLLYRQGSFLFIHAGLDDRIASTMEDRGFSYLNQLFRQQIQHDLFEFYYGPLANTMRTKYRDVDMPLSKNGVRRIYQLGVHAIVHGHRNRTNGQRIMLRQGMIHIECDVTLDRNSRKKEGLNGYGAGVTIIRPEGQIIGISRDYPFAKIFEPESFIR